MKVIIKKIFVIRVEVQTKIGLDRFYDLLKSLGYVEIENFCANRILCSCESLKFVNLVECLESNNIRGIEQVHIIEGSTQPF